MYLKIINIFLVFTSVTSKFRKPLLAGNEEESRATFNDLVSSNTYVDKSRFVEYFINSPNKNLVILAPRGFGKTINLSMLKAFLERRVGADGKVSKEETAKRHESFRYLGISRNDKVKFVEEHFAKYPIISFNFAKFDFNNYPSFKVSFSGIMQEAFSDHRYLLNNATLQASDRETFTALIDSSRDSVITAGKKLSELLYHHHGRACIVFIDDYDKAATIAAFIRKLKVEDADKIFNDLTRFLEFLLKDNPYVSHSLQTGITRLSGIYSSLADQLKFIGIFDDAAIGKSYGFTADDVDVLAAKFGFKYDKSAATEWYGGHQMKNSEETLFIPQSIARYLANKEIKLYWNGPFGVEYMQNLLLQEKCAKKFIRAIEKPSRSNGEEEIKLEFNKDRFLKFKSLVSDHGITPIIAAKQKDVMLQFLLENGIFTVRWHKSFTDHVHNPPGTVLAGLPNLESSKVFWAMVEIKNYYSLRTNARHKVEYFYSQYYKADSTGSPQENLATSLMNFLDSLMPNYLINTTYEAIVEFRDRKGMTLESRVTSNGFGKYRCLERSWGNITGENFTSIPDYVLFVDRNQSAQTTLRQIVDSKSYEIPYQVRSKILIGLEVHDYGWRVACLFNSTNMADAKYFERKNRVKRPWP